MSDMECSIAFMDFLFRETVQKPRYRIKNKNECWKYVNQYDMGRFVGSKLVKYDDKGLK